MLRKFLLGLFLVAGALLAPLATIPMASAITLPGEVTILAQTCGVTTSLISLNYGSMVNGAISGEQTLQLTGTGNTGGQILVSGTDWVGTGGQAQTTYILASKTHFHGAPSIDYSDKAGTVTSTPTSLPAGTPGSFSTPGAVTALYWQLKADLTQPSFSGMLSQTIDITTQC